DERGDVGDVHPGAQPIGLLARGERVVKVLRSLGVDRERRQLAQVDAILEARRGGIVRLEAHPRAAVDEQAFEHGLDVLRLAEHALELRAAATGAHDREIAGPRIFEALAVEEQRRACSEVRLAGDELAAPGDLDDDLGQILRKRRIVRPDPAAPSARPTAIRRSAFSEKASALTGSPLVWSEPIDGSTIDLPMINRRIAP